MLGEPDVQPRPPLVSPRLAYLAATALDRELLSEGQVCDMLAIDRLDLKDVLEPFEPGEAGSRCRSMPDPTGSPGLVLDTNVCINLLATEAVAALLGALAIPCLVPAPVLAEVTRDPVTRAALPDAGHPLRGHAPLLAVVDLTDREVDLFLDLVGAPAPDALGDGEAAAIAVAVHRGLDIALDDRKARRIIRDRFPQLRTFWTVDLLRAPSVVASARRRARRRPVRQGAAARPHARAQGLTARPRLDTRPPRGIPARMTDPAPPPPSCPACPPSRTATTSSCRTCGACCTTAAAAFPARPRR